MNRRERIKARLQLINQRLEAYYQAEAAILSGAQSYQLGNRKISRADLSHLQNEIRGLEKIQEELENALATGSTKRKSFRILYRDL